jgi:hypothetical protein
MSAAAIPNSSELLTSCSLSQEVYAHEFANSELEYISSLRPNNLARLAQDEQALLSLQEETMKEENHVFQSTQTLVYNNPSIKHISYCPSDFHFTLHRSLVKKLAQERDHFS